MNRRMALKLKSKDLKLTKRTKSCPTLQGKRIEKLLALSLAKLMIMM
jgi:hypothetical protein